MIADAIRTIASGGLGGPNGLEAVTMSLGGEGPPGENSVYSGLIDIANAIEEHARAVERLAEAVETFELVSD